MSLIDATEMKIDKSLQNFIEALPCLEPLHAVGPLAQARDAAQQEEEDKHPDHNLRRVTFKRRKKGVA
jgi:hypothetical protein